MADSQALLTFMPTNLLLAAAPADGGLFLVSFWKAIVFLPFLGVWGYIVSTVYDKHAARFFLPREKWNLLHLSLGTASILLGIGLPALIGITGELAFVVGLLTAIVLLVADLVIYAWVVNRDDRVPAQFRIGLNIGERLAAAKKSKAAAKAAGAVKLAIRGADKQIVAPPTQDSPEFEVRIAAEELYLKAMTMRASQVDVVPAGKDNAYAATALVDGVRTNLTTLPGASAIKVLDFWRSAGKMDLADRRRKQVKDIVIEQGTGVNINKRPIRMTSIGVQGGMRLSMLFDPESSVKRKPEELGLLDAQMAELKRIVADEKNGVVLIAGQPDGGRTTTLYTILQMHDAYTGQVTTAELEIQAPLEGIKGNGFDEAAEGTDFGTMVRSLLRRDPNVLGVAECPDAGTAKEVAKGDADRTRIYLCMKADDALKAVEMYYQLVGDNALATKHLRGAIAHRLMRKLCNNCRQPFPAPADVLKKLGVADGKQVQLYRKGGQVLIKNKPEQCPVCAGGGYLGQEGVFEVFQFGEEERAALEQGNFVGLKAALRKKQLPALGDAARAKVVKGITSLEEMQRVFAAPAPKTAAPAAAGQAAPAKPAPASPPKA